MRRTSEAPAIDYTLHDEVLPEAAALVAAGLTAWNDAAAPLRNVTALSAFARAPEGIVIGGAVGRTWGVCCELQMLWVDERHRRRGVASRLVQVFETRAQTRGCRTFYLETFSFQAPSLYRRLGYEPKLALSGFPDGIVKYVMVREVNRP
ncbi:MAG TPA: GNAT family N-acetyltransferase [Casimicrobiaceae bacterium]|nr:GNAT family N-acetyltransferase [Casimicrobiaceae bacterium]